MAAWLIWSTVCFSPRGSPENSQVILMRHTLPGLTVAWSFWYVGVGYFSLNVSERRQWIKFHAPSIRLYYVPLSFLFDSLTSAVLEAPLQTQNNIGPARQESSIMAPVVLPRFISMIQFGANFRVHLCTGRRSTSLFGCAHAGANAQTTGTVGAAAKQTSAEKERGWLHSQRWGTFI